MQNLMAIILESKKILEQLIIKIAASDPFNVRIYFGFTTIAQVTLHLQITRHLILLHKSQVSKQ